MQKWPSPKIGIRSPLVSQILFTLLLLLEVVNRAEIYIDIGDKEKNKEIFDNLLSKKDKIEKLFGESLTWERLDNRRAAEWEFTGMDQLMTMNPN